MTMPNEQIQALKAAAESVIQAYGDDWFGTGSQICTLLKSKVNLIAAAKPAAILSLLAEREADKALIVELQQGCENDPRIHEIIDLEEQITETNDALCKLLPGVQYMDPPDGGCVTPLEQVSRMVVDYRQQIAELSAHLRNAHAFIENTEAFGGEAATGIIKCGGAEWDIDASKAALVNSPMQARTLTVKLPSLNPQMFNEDVMFGYRKAQREAVDFCAKIGITLKVGGGDD